MSVQALLEQQRLAKGGQPKRVAVEFDPQFDVPADPSNVLVFLFVISLLAAILWLW